MGTAVPGTDGRGRERLGRVRGTDGSGLAKARVEMTDAHGNVRTVMTNAFGYYTFEDVKTGEAYVVGVQSRTYTYGTRLLQVFDR